MFDVFVAAVWRMEMRVNEDNALHEVVRVRSRGVTSLTRKSFLLGPHNQAVWWSYERLDPNVDLSMPFALKVGANRLSNPV